MGGWGQWRGGLVGWRRGRFGGAISISRGGGQSPRIRAHCLRSGWRLRYGLFRATRGGCLVGGWRISVVVGNWRGGGVGRASGGGFGLLGRGAWQFVCEALARGRGRVGFRDARCRAFGRLRGLSRLGRRRRGVCCRAHLFRRLRGLDSVVVVGWRGHSSHSDWAAWGDLETRVAGASLGVSFEANGAGSRIEGVRACLQTTNWDSG